MRGRGFSRALPQPRSAGSEASRLDLRYSSCVADCIRGALAEAATVFHGEAAQMGEAPGGRNIGYARLGICLQQCLPSPREPQVAQVAHRRDALEGVEVLEQGTAGDLRCRGESGDRDRAVEMRLEVVDR